MRMIEDLKIETALDGTLKVHVTAAGISLTRTVIGSELRSKPLRKHVAELHDEAAATAADLKADDSYVIPKSISMLPESTVLALAAEERDREIAHENEMNDI